MISPREFKALRVSKGLTQKELAEIVGTTQTTITNIEKGITKNPSVDIAIKISSALGVNIYNLFADESLMADSVINLDTGNQINELKAENERLNEKLGEKNREALLYVKIIEGLEEKNEAINEHLIAWPEHFINGFLSSVRSDLKNGSILEDDAVRIVNQAFNAVSMAFLFSTNFKPGFIDILEKRLKWKYESIYDEDFRLFINMLKEIQADYKDFEKEVE